MIEYKVCIFSEKGPLKPQKIADIFALFLVAFQLGYYVQVQNQSVREINMYERNEEEKKKKTRKTMSTIIIVKSHAVYTQREKPVLGEGGNKKKKSKYPQRRRGMNDLQWRSLSLFPLEFSNVAYLRSYPPRTANCSPPSWPRTAPSACGLGPPPTWRSPRCPP